MRDKLIELLKYRRHLETSELADVLLANGIIVPPCKVGDTVYAITKDNGGEYIGSVEIQNVQAKYGYDIGKSIQYYFEGVVSSGLLIGRRYVFYDFRIGKTVFLTREEAEAALKGGEG